MLEYATTGPLPTANNRVVAWLPLAAWTAYLVGLLLLFRFGPFEWRYRNDTTLFGFLFIVHLASSVGFVLGLARPAARPTRIIPIDKVVRVLAVLSTAGIIFGLIDQYRSGPNLLAAITDPASSRREWIDTRGLSAFSYVALLFSVAHFPLVATVFGYWKNISTRAKWCAVTTASGMCLIAVWSGSRAGMHAILVVALVFNMAGAFAKRAIGSMRTIAIVGSVLFLGFAFYAGYVSAKRASKKTIDYSKYVMRTSSNVDFDHPFVSDAPPALEPIILSGSFYLTHGFDGLAACLHKPFIGVGFGLAHSAFLMRTWEKLTGDERINQLSCFTRLMEEDGYSSALWVTVYAWVWSDMGLWGTPLFFLMLGFAFASSWRDVLRERSNALAAWALAWIVYTVAVTPIIFPPGDYGAFIGFWGAGILWVLTRSRLAVA